MRVKEVMLWDERILVMEVRSSFLGGRGEVRRKEIGRSSRARMPT